jgi:uncharacterized iron-regulated membrane protein
MKIRDITNKIHLILGIASGIVVFIVALTGCIWAFEEEIRYATQRDQLFVPAQSAPRLPISGLIEAVKSADPSAKISQVRVFADGQRAAQLITKDKHLLTANPYTGQLLASHNQETDWLLINLKLHRTLLLGDVGKAIIFWNTWIFMILLVTGFVLWLPARIKHLRAALTIKWQAKAAKRTYDLHSVLGFYAIPVLLVIGITGVNMILPNGRKKEKPVVYQKFTSNQMLDKAVSLALNRDEFETVRVSLPKDSLSPIRVQVNYPTSGLRRESTFSFDPATAQLLKANRYQDMTFNARFWQSDTEIHTGEIWGFVGKCLAFLASLIAASMPITGFLIWYNKQRKTQKISQMAVITTT